MPVDQSKQVIDFGNDPLVQEAQAKAHIQSVMEAKSMEHTFTPASTASKKITTRELEDGARLGVPSSELLGTYNNTGATLAKYQGGGEQFGRALYGGVGKGALGFLEGLGYVADIPGWFAAMQDADNTFADRDNWLSKAMKSGKESIDEAAPIYRRDPNASFDFTDSGYNFQMLQGIVESATQFTMLGGAVGSLVGRTVGGLARMGALGGLDEAIVSQIGTAVVTNMVEGKMMALDTQKKVYNEAISKGMSEEDAQKISLKAGNEVVWKNKVNIVGDAIQLKALFGGPKAYSKVADVARKEATKNASKSLLKKVGTFAAENMATEGGEEWGGDLVVKSAEENASATIEGRKAKGLIDITSDYLSTASAYETFLVGAVSGAAMGGGIHGTKKLLGDKTPKLEDEPVRPVISHNPDLKHPGEFKESDPFADFKDEEFKPGKLQGDRENENLALSPDIVKELNEKDYESKKENHEKGREARKKAWKEAQGIYDEAPADGNPEALAKHEEWKKKREEQVLGENQSYEEALKAFNENEKLKEADMVAQSEYDKKLREWEHYHGPSKNETANKIEEALRGTEEIAAEKAKAIAEGNQEYADLLDEVSFGRLAIDAFRRGNGDSFKEIAQSYANATVDPASPDAKVQQEMKDKAAKLLERYDTLENNYNTNIAKHGTGKGAAITEVQHLMNVTNDTVVKYNKELEGAQAILANNISSLENNPVMNSIQISAKTLEMQHKALIEAYNDLMKTAHTLDAPSVEAFTKKYESILRVTQEQGKEVEATIAETRRLAEEAGHDTHDIDFSFSQLEAINNAASKRAQAVVSSLAYQQAYENMVNPSYQKKKVKEAYDKTIDYINKALSKDSLDILAKSVITNVLLPDATKSKLIDAIKVRRSLIELKVTSAIARLETDKAKYEKVSLIKKFTRSVFGRIKESFALSDNVTEDDIELLKGKIDEGFDFDSASKFHKLRYAEIASHIVASVNNYKLGLTTLDSIKGMLDGFGYDDEVIKDEDIFPHELQRQDVTTEKSKYNPYRPSLYEISLRATYDNGEFVIPTETLHDMMRMFAAMDTRDGKVKSINTPTVKAKRTAIYNEVVRRDIGNKGVYTEDGVYVVRDGALVNFNPALDTEIAIELEGLGVKAVPVFHPEFNKVTIGKLEYDIDPSSELNEMGLPNEIRLTKPGGYKREVVFTPEHDTYWHLLYATEMGDMLDSLYPVVLTSDSEDNTILTAEEILAQQAQASKARILQAFADIKAKIEIEDKTLERLISEGDESKIAEQLKRIEKDMQLYNGLLDQVKVLDLTNADIPFPSIDLQPLINLNYDANADAKFASTQYPEGVSREELEGESADSSLLEDEQQKRLESIIDGINSLRDYTFIKPTLKAILDGVPLEKLNLSDLVKLGVLTVDEAFVIAQDRAEAEEIELARLEAEAALTKGLLLDLTQDQADDAEGGFKNSDGIIMRWPEYKDNLQYYEAVNDFFLNPTVNLSDYSFELYLNPKVETANYANAVKIGKDVSVLMRMVDKKGKVFEYKGFKFENLEYGAMPSVSKNRNGESNKESIINNKIAIVNDLLKGGRATVKINPLRPGLAMEPVESRAVKQILNPDNKVDDKIYVSDKEGMIGNKHQFGESSHPVNGGWAYMFTERVDKDGTITPYPVKLHYDKVGRTKSLALAACYHAVLTMNNVTMKSEVTDAIFSDPMFEELRGQFSGITVGNLVSMLAYNGNATIDKLGHPTIAITKGDDGRPRIVVGKGNQTYEWDSLFSKDGENRVELFVAMVEGTFAPVYNRYLNESILDLVVPGKEFKYMGKVFGATESYNNVITHPEIGVLTTNVKRSNGSCLRAGSVQLYGYEYKNAPAPKTKTSSKPAGKSPVSFETFKQKMSKLTKEELEKGISDIEALIEKNNARRQKGFEAVRTVTGKELTKWNKELDELEDVNRQQSSHLKDLKSLLEDKKVANVTKEEVRKIDNDFDNINDIFSSYVKADIADMISNKTVIENCK